ncbi:TPA: hypothetical protein QDC44_008055 [Burkholderia cepacia ATCC 25416]|nr:hypothetical protein [Burkholderia cepacia ATCC 25416]HDV6365874.1 hypothetical protein [Burkholderia cepacia]
MSRQPHALPVLPLASIDSLSATGELVAFNVGADDALYAAFALEPLDDRTRSDGASFAITTPLAAQRHRLIAWREGETLLDLVVDNKPFDIHEIQPVGDDLLVVCCRSSYRGQFRRDTTAKLIAIDPVTTRGGGSSSASPKRKRRLRPSLRSARRFGARVSAAAVRSFATAVSHGWSATQSAA